MHIGKKWKVREEGPYCSTCFDAKDKLIRLIQNFGSNYECQHCKNHIDLEPDRIDDLPRYAQTDDYDPLNRSGY